MNSNRDGNRSGIVVVGSINMDIVNEVKKHPLPGETIHGLSTAYFPGGKGANQAVAAARAGGHVAMVGAVGQDAFAKELIASLSESGVDASAVSSKPGTSGLAFITVDEHGENSIILSAGANGQLLPEDARAISGSPAVILLQNEIPWEVNFAAMDRASRLGACVLYNPAPAMVVPSEAYPYIHTLVLNETEAAVLTGREVGEDADEAEIAADRLLEAGVRAVILTLGSKGCLYKDAEGEKYRQQAYRVQAVDTTAAGDTFLGAYACALTEGLPIAERLAFASAAAALTVTAHGAQASIPRRASIEAFMRER